MDERLILAVDAMAFCFQLLTIAVALLIMVMGWSHVERARMDTYWLKRQRMLDQKEAARQEKGFE